MVSAREFPENHASYHMQNPLCATYDMSSIFVRGAYLIRESKIDTPRT